MFLPKYDQIEIRLIINGNLLSKLITEIVHAASYLVSVPSQTLPVGQQSQLSVFVLNSIGEIDFGFTGSVPINSTSPDVSFSPSTGVAEITNGLGSLKFKSLVADSVTLSAGVASVTVLFTPGEDQLYIYIYVLLGKCDTIRFFRKRKKRRRRSKKKRYEEEEKNNNT